MAINTLSTITTGQLMACLTMDKQISSKISRVVIVWVIMCNLLVGCTSGQSELLQLDQLAAVRTQLGFAYLAQGEYQLAEQNIQRAISYAPQDPKVLLALAVYYQRVGNRSLADKRYRQALLLVPNNNALLNNYGAFLCDIGQYIAAKQSLEQTRLLSEPINDQGEALERAAYCFLAASYYEDAEILFIRLLENWPDKRIKMLSTAANYSRQDNCQAAQLLFRIVP